ncbi:PP2C family protein-serine/threonine phosphatase [Streptomyces sp. TP-A0356]|uniref:PP2C family protein-serine/threonine phosphatase n=1 Tax=Streptomyces sp. TP-A0356 TaxID=1359208 RepID=UPI0007C703AB|nr:PP2C family protein-serine/threonine phosphatase [Streptomyces sp. TP-A0356]
MIPLALIIAVTVVDVLTPTHIHLGPLLVVAPALTPSFAGPRLTALVGGLAVLAQVVIAALRGGFTLNHQVQIVTLAFMSALIVIYSGQRHRRMRQLEQVRSVSEATQHVVLRPLPHRLGPLRIASSYLAAEEEAQIGGDLYAATRTDFRTRLIIGDVRGKGLTAISDASALMGAFREAAHRCATILELADALERSVRRHLEEYTDDPDADERGEHFVTALMLDIPDHDPSVQMANCGHPPPLQLHKKGMTILHPRRPEPPLGMCTLARTGLTVDAYTFDSHDTLLLYTDGVIEARSPDGSFYPLTERVSQWADCGPEALLQHIREDLLDHVGGRLEDDAALVVIQRSPTMLPTHHLRDHRVDGNRQGAEGTPSEGATTPTRSGGQVRIAADHRRR